MVQLTEEDEYSVEYDLSREREGREFVEYHVYIWNIASIWVSDIRIIMFVLLTLRAFRLCTLVPNESEFDLNDSNWNDVRSREDGERRG